MTGTWCASQIASDALAPGSALAVSHASEGHEVGKFGTAREGWNNATSQLVLRDKPEVEAFFVGIELLDLGVVIIPAWRPGHELGAKELALDYDHASVGIKRVAL